MSFGRPKPSKDSRSDTQQLLDQMMDACKLPDAEKRRLRMLGNGKAVARRPPNASSRHQGRYEDMLRGVALNPKIVTTRYTRAQADVVAGLGPNGYDRPQWGGAPKPRDNDAEKQSLQLRMEFGKHAPPHASALSSSGRRAPPPQPPPQPKAQSEEAALHEAIGAEIEERRAFLEDMRACGRGKEHEGPITAQIAERVEELKTLERLMKN